MYLLKHTKPKAAGYIIIDDGFTKQEYDTVQCVHCQRHWKVVPGSGRKRGWCFKCGGVTCGSKHCETCIPLFC